MAEKKGTATGKKAAPAAKTATKKKAAKGSAYTCGVCGLAVVVDEVCGCVDAHAIICCGKPMKEKRARAK